MLSIRHMIYERCMATIKLSKAQCISSDVITEKDLRLLLQSSHSFYQSRYTTTTNTGAVAAFVAAGLLVQGMHITELLRPPSLSNEAQQAGKQLTWYLIHMSAFVSLMHCPSCPDCAFWPRNRLWQIDLSRGFWCCLVVQVFLLAKVVLGPVHADPCIRPFKVCIRYWDLLQSPKLNSQPLQQQQWRLEMKSHKLIFFHFSTSSSKCCLQRVEEPAAIANVGQAVAAGRP